MNLKSVTNGNILLRELKLGFLFLKEIFNFFFIVFLYHKLETLDGYIMVFSLKDAHFRCTFHVKDPLIFEYSESKRVDWVCVYRIGFDRNQKFPQGKKDSVKYIYNYSTLDYGSVALLLHNAKGLALLKVKSEIH